MTFLSPLEKYFIACSYLCKDNDSFFSSMQYFDSKKWSYFLGRQVRETSVSEKKKIEILRGVNFDIRWLNQKKGSLLTIDSPHYPHKLKEIPDPPVILFVKGDPLLLNRPAISIVGTRKPDKQGVYAAQSMGKYFSNMSLNVISGLAFGIDVNAHKGVLSVQSDSSESKKYMLGCAVVVLGSAIDYIYPRSHQYIASRILQFGGVLISENPPNAFINKFSFISRNRIISGLAMNVVVVQAPGKSGALATARFALEQGRGLWVHRCGCDTSFEGSHRLEKEGAGIIESRGEELFQGEALTTLYF